MTPADAAIVHKIPGRVRLRIEDRRGDANYFSTLSEEISGMPDIHGVKTNPATGSVVITFSGSMEELVRQLREHDLFVEERHEPGSVRRAEAPGNGADTRPFLLVSNRDINPMFMLGTLLAAIGVVQTFRGKILVPSLSVLWYAMETFRQSRTAHSPRSTPEDMEGHQAGLQHGPGSDDLVH
jgi:hypothetical protein